MRTEEIVFGPPSDSHKVPQTEQLKQEVSYKHLGAMICFDGKTTLSTFIHYFPRLRSFRESRHVFLQFCLHL